jgi:hypothetical protein
LAGVLLAYPALAQMGGFGGPSVLTRGTRPAGREGARPIYLRGSLDIMGIYQSGFISPATDERGNLIDEGSYGGGLGWNVSANRQGRRDNVFFGYGGNYSAYKRASYFSGLNQSLTLSYGRQLSRRWNMFLAQSGESYSNSLNNVRAPLTDEFTAELPGPEQEFIDNRYYALSSAAGLSYQKSARMSFSMSGGAMFARRHSEALASSNGFIGTGNMAYMLNRRTQIGVSYSYGTYYLTRHFGEGQIQSSNFIFGRLLSRRWYLNVGAGAYHADTKRLQRVPVDPFIAALTGQTETLEVFNGKRAGFSGQASVAGRFREASVNLGYQRGVSPGNGFYFLAETESIFARVGYETRRRFSMFGRVDWMTLRAVTQDIGKSTSFGAGFDTGYRLTSILHLRGSVQVRRWDVNNAFFERNRFFASVGLSISPGELPLALW